MSPMSRAQSIGHTGIPTGVHCLGLPRQVTSVDAQAVVAQVTDHRPLGPPFIYLESKAVHKKLSPSPVTNFYIHDTVFGATTHFGCARP